MNDAVARFHFDPMHDATRVPTLDAFVAWLTTRMTDDDEGSLARAFATAKEMVRPVSLVGNLMLLIPSVRLQSKGRLLEQCIIWAMPQIRQIHDVMREFGVDLTEHQSSYMVESMISIAMYDRMIETATSSFNTESGIVDGMTTEERLAGSLAEMRCDFEAQALNSLFDNEDLRGEWPRLVAALRASQDEITTPEIRKSIDKVADHIEHVLSRHG